MLNKPTRGALGGRGWLVLALLLPLVGGCLRPRYYENSTTTRLDSISPAGKEGRTGTAVKSTASKPLPADAKSDSGFFTTAAHCMAFQVRLGQLMVKQAEDSNLELFGQQLVIDYSVAGQTMADLADSKGFQVSDSLSSEDRYKIARLGRLLGKSFARAVLEESARCHREAIFIHATAAARSGDPEVRELAQQTLPMLQHHLDEALRLAKSY